MPDLSAQKEARSRSINHRFRYRSRLKVFEKRLLLVESLKYLQVYLFWELMVNGIRVWVCKLSVHWPREQIALRLNFPLECPRGTRLKSGLCLKWQAGCAFSLFCLVSLSLSIFHGSTCLMNPWDTGVHLGVCFCRT